MIRYKIPGIENDTFISLDSSEPESPSPIVVEGELKEVVAGTLAIQSGLYGHLIGTHTTPIDLAHAMSSPSMRSFFPSLIDGEEILAGFKRSVPDDRLD